MNTRTARQQTEHRGVNLVVLQAGIVWLMFAVSFFVKVEPAPVDLIFVVVVILFLSSGLSVSAPVMPIAMFLLLYNIGGIFSYIGIAPNEDGRMFIVTSCYMAVTAIFFALYVAQDTVRHMAIIKNGYVFAATIASALGIVGILNIAGLGSSLSLYSRAVATFKDPNVFATFLLLPTVMLMQGFMLGTQRHKLVSLAALFLMFAGIFLAFSRGAWISLVGSSVLLIVLTFALTPSLKLKGRVMILTILGVLAAGVLLAIILSIPQFNSLFLDRFTLVKSYDAGETGRFGDQLNSIPMLLERPLGFGPRQYSSYFGEDPHNSYINGFSAYGWLGGIMYILIVISTIWVGFRAILVKTPWQNWAIAVFCPLTMTLLQSIQIDVDHWRHLYWMIGMMWGIYAASWSYQIQEKHQNRLRVADHQIAN